MSKDKNKIKEERDALDSIVTNNSLPREVCPNASSHVSNGDTIPGEGMFYHDAVFLVRRIAVMEMGYNADSLLDWTYADAGNFYIEHNLSETHHFKTTFNTEGKKSLSNWYFKGRSSTYMQFLSFRWDNNMAFDNYKSRVEKCIEMRKIEDLADIKEIVARFVDKEDQVAKLNGELDKIKAKVTDPQLQQILHGINITVADLMANGD